MFGDDLESQVLLNIGEARTPDGKAFWEAYIVQISFSLVLTCHIPFIFTSGKEGILIIIDEFDRKSISNALWHKLQGNGTFAEETKGTLPPNPELAIPGDNMTYTEVARQTKTVKESEVGPSETRPSMKSIALLDGVPAEDANRMAYKDMNPIYYVTGSMAFYFIIVIGAIMIPDVSVVFDFVSAFAVSAIGFFFPAVLYPMAVKKYNVTRTWKVKRNLCLSNLFLVLGFINFCLGLFVAFYDVLS